MLCPQVRSQVQDTPNSSRLKTPDRAIDMKADMTNDPVSL